MLSAPTHYLLACRQFRPDRGCVTSSAGYGLRLSPGADDRVTGAYVRRKRGARRRHSWPGA